MNDPLQDLIVNVMLAQQKERGETPDKAACLALYKERQKAQLTFMNIMKKETPHEPRTRKRRKNPQG